MFELMVEDTFDAAHRLVGYSGNCNNLHGHTWKVRMIVKPHELVLNDVGLSIDFKDLKRLLRGILEHLDHTYLNEHPIFENKNPTAENIAKFLYDELDDEVGTLGGTLVEIYVYETSNTGVLYRE